MTTSNKKGLDAAHHKWIRKILHIPWKDKVMCARARELTKQDLVENIIKERRLEWLGPEHHMERGCREDRESEEDQV